MVPKGARDCWAQTLSSSLSNVVNNPVDVSEWVKLFMLAKCTLASPAAGHRLHRRDIQKLVKSRLQKWANGDVEAL